MKLSQLPIHKPAKVIGIQDSDLLLKLFEMGLLPGEEVEVENVAPLGDPIAIRVGEYKMCLRLAEADCIDVEVK